jgi:transketolase N-terminal domain/subunit
MTTTITQEDNLILQSYYIVLLLKELGEVKFEDSSIFNSLNLPSEIKKSLKDIKIQNQGSAIMALYAMLVVPREIIAQEFENEYQKINDFLRCEVTLHKTT